MCILSFVPETYTWLRKRYNRRAGTRKGGKGKESIWDGSLYKYLRHRENPTKKVGKRVPNQRKDQERRLLRLSSTGIFDVLKSRGLAGLLAWSAATCS